MSSLHRALVNTIQNKDYEIQKYAQGSTRAKHMGEALEQYVL